MPKTNKSPREARVLLGWETPPQQRTIGFAGHVKHHPRNKHADDNKLISLAGEQHIITLAQTGSGKTRGVSLPNLLKYEGPVVCLDVKGEAYEITARQRRNMGHQVVKLDPFNLLGSSDRFDPLDILKLPGANIAPTSQLLAELISYERGSLRDVFWDANGKGLHSGVIAAVASLKDKADRSLVKALQHLSVDDVVYQLAVLMDTQAKTLHPLAKREIAAFLAMPDVTRGGVLATAQSYIKPFIGEEVEATLQDSSFSIADFAAGKPIDVFIIIPPEMLKPAAGLLRLWIGSLIRALLSRQNRPPQRTLFLLDEAASLGRLSLLEDIMTLGRGYGVRCHTFWQDLDQVKQNYPTAWRTILNNCGVIQIFGVANRAMANDWSGYLQHSASELMNLRPEEQILLIQNRGEFRCKRLDYLNDAMFQGLYDTSRFYKTAPTLSR